MTLNKAAILAANDLPTETVDVPEWGGDVTVRTMTGRERDEFEAEILKRPKAADGSIADLRGLKVHLVIRTVVDESGAPLFTDEDGEALNGKSAAALNRIADVAQRLNGLTKKDVDELAGN